MGINGHVEGGCQLTIVVCFHGAKGGNFTKDESDKRRVCEKILHLSTCPKYLPN